MVYFYGGAFCPMTLAHLNIIDGIVNDMNEKDLLIIGITDHDYKKFQYSFKLRKEIVEKNLVKYAGKKIKLVKQTERTWKFLHNLGYSEYTLVVGEDEYNDLKAGKWHYSNEILNTYRIKVIPRGDKISATAAREIINRDINDIKLLEYISEITLKILKNEYSKY